VTPPARQAATDSVVPAGLNPSLGGAANDMPLSYKDGCHTQMDLPASTASCLYGNLSSSTTIALFGDSHALSWFPAFSRLAQDKGWRLLSLTMSACTPADIPAWNGDWGRVMPNCPTWRRQAIAELVQVRPDIIVVAGTRGFATVDNSGRVAVGAFRTRMWIQGMKRTLKQLLPAAHHVIYLADLPSTGVVPPVCLSAHMKSILACATPVDEAINYAWLNTEITTVASVGADFIDPERWVCPTSPCLPVLGNLLVHRDQGHLTATFAGALWRKMEQAVLRAISLSTTKLVW
jgi:SGNH domain (fused to AT3 domains)